MSGGMDSAVMAAYADRKVDHLTAITFDYNQANSKETDCARIVAKTLGIEHKMIESPFVGDAAWFSALTNPGRFTTPTNQTLGKLPKEIPITYVPLRNTIFLSLSAALLESTVLEAIGTDNLVSTEVEAHIYIGANSVDYSGYPDCRPEYFETLNKTLRYGSKIGAQLGISPNVRTPLINLSKAEIIKMGIELNIPLGQTWSCYKSSYLPCNKCDSCLLRAKGFIEAGMADPLMVRLDKNS